MFVVNPGQPTAEVAGRGEQSSVGLPRATANDGRRMQVRVVATAVAVIWASGHPDQQSNNHKVHIESDRP
jgi:hypothetical protein